ncbi:hypothetical protein HMP0721_2413 [Pseudoramibacter alactolyticus ATCC 23263]|uniref:Uncharacterized protein n=1 Tax=Pseudoramibacter alactolyticus ATCC 23263 TaxID=887929 RepID=E6MK77_9FIRM|nr:hypothetical protein [Pseudoramibacter alactolyticus]EFV00596.1 hypothetical protein HMP0721_2413 [Pseudoramibacter alactolyticus ATCC 23263]
MMGIKKIQKYAVLIALTLGMGIALLAGCGLKPPTFGTEAKGYDKFEQLEESSIGLKSGGKIQAFVPKGGSKYASDTYLTGSANGVALNLRSVDASLVNSAGGFKTYLKKYGSLSTPNLNAAVDTVGKKVSKSKDGNTVYRKGFQVLSRYDNTYYSQCQTEFVTKIVNKKGETTNYVVGTIKVNSYDSNDKTDKTVDELSAYYNIKVYWDAKKAKSRAKHYTNNPPTTKRILAGSFTVPIPTGWRLDSGRSTGAVSFYGPNGTSTASQHLLIARSYINSQTQNYSDADFENYFRNALQSRFKGMTVEMKATKSPVSPGKAYQFVMSRGNARINGYFFFSKYNMLMIYNVSNGNMSNDQQNVLNTAFNGIVDYDSLRK